MCCPLSVTDSCSQSAWFGLNVNNVKWEDSSEKSDKNIVREAGGGGDFY